MDSLFMLLGSFLGVGPFLVKLFAGSLLFSGHFRRKERFLFRLTGGFLLELLLGTVIFRVCYSSDSWLIHNTLCYLLLFLLSLISLFAAFDEPVTTLILCAVSGYMTEHISSQFLQMNLWWSAKVWMQEEQELVDARHMLYILAAQMLIFVAVAAAVYFLFARRTTYAVQSKTVERRMFWLSIATLLVVLLMSSVRDSYAQESFALMLVSRLLSIFCCACLLYIRSDVLEKSQMEREREELRRLYELERERYEQSRENIELINIKCHDLKHRIGQWDGRVPPEEIQEVKRLVGIYDSTVKTENDTLDTLLTEHSLSCEKQGIRLSCMVDGKKLSFMPEGDICALFGNAVENAIEAVSKLECPEERCISFQARESRGMLVVTIENCFSGPLEFEDGLPKTTKGETGWHGYGLKSIRRVAEKYGGQATVQADDMFHLTILIPLPEPET